MTEVEKELIQHAVGANSAYPKRRWGFRNSFCAEVGSTDHEQWSSLVSRGLAEAGGRINDGRDQYFRVTKKGCLAAGIGPSATKRATQFC